MTKPYQHGSPQRRTRRRGKAKRGTLARRIPPDQWEKYKPELKRLYLQEEKTVKEVKRYMQQEYGFVASLRQFNYRFLNVWGWKHYHRENASAHGDAHNAEAPEEMGSRPCQVSRGGYGEWSLPGRVHEFEKYFSDLGPHVAQNLVAKLMEGAGHFGQLGSEEFGRVLREKLERDYGSSPEPIQGTAADCLVQLVDWTQRQLVHVTEAKVLEVIVRQEDGDESGMDVDLLDQALSEVLRQRWVQEDPFEMAPHWEKTCNRALGIPAMIAMHTMCSLILATGREVNRSSTTGHQSIESMLEDAKLGATTIWEWHDVDIVNDFVEQADWMYNTDCDGTVAERLDVPPVCSSHALQMDADSDCDDDESMGSVGEEEEEEQEGPVQRHPAYI